MGQKDRGTQKGNKTTRVAKPCIEVCGMIGASLSAGYRPCHVEVIKGVLFAWVGCRNPMLTMRLSFPMVFCTLNFSFARHRAYNNVAYLFHFFLGFLDRLSHCGVSFPPDMQHHQTSVTWVVFLSCILLLGQVPAFVRCPKPTQIHVGGVSMQRCAFFFHVLCLGSLCGRFVRPQNVVDSYEEV